MGRYSHDMSDERTPAKVWDEGWYEFVVSDMVEKTSKSGNEMFVITLDNAEGSLDVYAIAVRGKRWFLKRFLEAVGVKETPEKVMEWDVSECIGKTVRGYVADEESTYTDRDGNKRKNIKSVVKNIISMFSKMPQTCKGVDSDVAAEVDNLVKHEPEDDIEVPF